MVIGLSLGLAALWPRLLDLVALIDFHALPLQAKIERASVIVTANFVDDHGMVRCTVAETLKQSAAVTVPFKPGDDIAECGWESKAGVQYGEGAVVFLFGSPASFRESMSYFDGRLPAAGGMSLDRFRGLVAADMSRPPR